MMFGIEVHKTRESCFSESWGPLGAIIYISIVFSCVLPEERIESFHTAIKPILVGVYIDVCKFLPSAYMIMELN